MRILFMGTGTFAVPSLQALLKSGHDVVGVVTQPDRPAGRGRQLRMSAIKLLAVESVLPVYQPEKVRTPEFLEIAKDISPDATVVAAFGQIIPQSILDIPRLGNINVHASILPKYRGAAPVHYALFNGEKTTGVTTMLMAAGLDTGPILLCREIDILPGEDEGALEGRLAEIGAELLLETLEGLQNGTVTPKPQDDSQSSLAPSVKKEHCLIHWDNDACTVVNRIRGCTPRPGAYTYLNNSPVKVWESRLGESSALFTNPGEILDVTAEGIVVAAGSGSVILTEVQPENKKRMPAVEFARGYRIAKGISFQTCSD